MDGTAENARLRRFSLLAFICLFLVLVSCSAGHVGDDASSWLGPYIDWHTRARGTPEARYLVWICSNSSKAVHINIGIGCSGLGDRLRGMELGLRMAALLKRVFLIHHDDPSNIFEYLVPNQINWRVDPSWQLKLDEPAAGYDGPFDNDLFREVEKGNDTVPAGHVFLVSTNLYPWTVRMPNETWQWHTNQYYEQPAATQIAQALFKLSPQLDKVVSNVLQAMGVREGQRYMAVHIRLGGFPGEHQPQVRSTLGGNATHEQLLQGARRCFHKLRVGLGQQQQQQRGIQGVGEQQAPQAPWKGPLKHSRRLRCHRQEQRGQQRHRLQLPHGHQCPHRAHLRLLQHLSMYLPQGHDHHRHRELQQQGQHPQQQRARSPHYAREQQQQQQQPRQRQRQRSALPIVVITDNTELRRRLASGALAPFVGPNTGSTHIMSAGKAPDHGRDARTNEWVSVSAATVATMAIDADGGEASGVAETESGEEQVLSSFLDFGILVRATCLVYTRSSFSIQAHMVGGHTCVSLYDDCRV